MSPANSATPSVRSIGRAQASRGRVASRNARSWRPLVTSGSSALATATTGTRRAVAGLEAGIGRDVDVHHARHELAVDGALLQHPLEGGPGFRTGLAACSSIEPEHRSRGRRHHVDRTAATRLRRARRVPVDCTTAPRGLYGALTMGQSGSGSAPAGDYLIGTQGVLMSRHRTRRASAVLAHRRPALVRDRR